MASNDRISKIKAQIAAIPDFPKKGILFRDLCPVLRDPNTFKDLIDLLVEHISSTNPGVEVIVGLEARGFLYGPIVAQRLEVGFVLARKAGKLPGKTFKYTYTLEYGTDTLEVQANSMKPNQKVIIIDDLLATGGTMTAACHLMKEAKVDILECIVVIEMSDLKGRDKVPAPLYSLIELNE